MTTVKKDINFFKAYKDGPGKASGNSIKRMILVIVCFLLIVLVTFGTLYIINSNMKRKIDSINTELSRPEVAQLQIELNKLAKKNELLNSYFKSISKAKSSFDKSKIIDSTFFNNIYSCMPNNCKISSIIISTQNVQISCSSTSQSAPVIFTQNLNAKGIFNNITYNGITTDGDGKSYFNLSCSFGGN